MAQTAMTIRVDNQIKTQFDSLCEQFGMSANAAVNVFIKAVVRTRTIPFVIKADEQPERVQLLKALRASRKGRPEMSLKEINDEIRAVRQERSQK